ncbi:MAG: hypothetical protein QM725_02750 [Lacibacter sp.]
MKNRLIFFVTIIAVVFAGCTKDMVSEKYTFFRPVYKTRAEVKANIKSDVPVNVSTPGKLFVKGNYVYLNEINKGIHIIDFSNPASPKNVSFINIPGCEDMAVRGNYLYADCYTDLVTMDISDPLNVVVKQFIEGVFPHRVYVGGFIADTNRVITEWVRVDTVINHRMEQRQPVWFANDVLMSFASTSSSYSPGSGVTNGVGGSMARFGLMGERLYTISWSDMKVFNTADASKPVYVKTIAMNQGSIETIFPYKDKLFIGSQSGMFIYNAANPDNPVKQGQFSHARVCDPVIADDNYAYVTLRSGSSCMGFLNQLDVIDVSNLSAPVLVKSYLLTSPFGLSKDGNTLLICDGKDGLKVFNAANASNVFQTGKVTGIETYDVIALNGIALTVAKDGLYFINYTNPSAPAVVGKVTITHP